MKVLLQNKELPNKLAIFLPEYTAEACESLLFAVSVLTGVYLIPSNVSISSAKSAAKKDIGVKMIVMIAKLRTAMESNLL